MVEMGDLVEGWRRSPIELFPERSHITTRDLHERYPQRGIVACDFHVHEIHLGESVTGGYVRDGVLNVDHHAPTPRMARHVSSANLAIEHVRKHGPVTEAETVVVINHTDCDSVLSSAIMRGLLPPEERFGSAALAADHTGAEDEIADLLQTISDLRDLCFSLANLQRLLEGTPLDPEATRLLRQRQTDRALIQKMVAGGAFRRVGGVAYATLTEKVDGGLLPALFSDVPLLMIAAPAKHDAERWEMRVRLGLGAPDGLRLNELEIQEFDPNFGGRWNAGANARGGGVAIHPDRYAGLLAERLQSHLAAATMDARATDSGHCWT